MDGLLGRDKHSDLIGDEMTATTVKAKFMPLIKLAFNSMHCRRNPRFLVNKNNCTVSFDTLKLRDLP